MLITRLIFSALMVAVGVSSPASAASVSTVEPLNPTELNAVVAEIEAMVKTDESEVSAFVVREATPARIDQLYQMPELLTLDKTIRENGLIFAGQSSLLTFTKPSNILHKVSSWFPEEIAAARASNNNSFFGFIHVWGPYPNWGDEQTAFLTLWNCMPQIAWMNPTENPFMRRLNDGLPFMAIAAKHSGEIDFGHCVNVRSGQRPAWKAENIPVIEQEVRAMAARATPVLRSKFSQFLMSNRCAGIGPDDCVLILLLWASLVPADPELAAALQTLEAEVAPTGPLPELQRPADQYEAGTQEGERRFDEGLRKAAFMRAKLLSLFNAPSAWPPQTLATTVHQMTLLQQTLSAAIDHRWNQYELDYYNEPINPWSVFALNAAKTPQVHNAMLAELGKLTTLGSDARCTVHEQWFKHGGAALQTAYALQQLQKYQTPRCASPDWAWLKQGETAQALDLRTAYLALPSHIDSGALHDSLLSGLTDNGEACFNADATPIADWLQPVCTAWISEPQAVQRQLVHSQLTLSDAEQFQSAPLTSIPESVTSQGDSAAQAEWLGGLVANTMDAVGQKMQILAAEFNRRGATIYAAKKWNHPDHDTALIELQLNLTEQSPETAWPIASSRLMMMITPEDITLAGIPQRFGYQYDEGEIAHVSDLDEDGQLEVWLSGTFGECDGEELEPGVDCAIEVLHMGEIRGDALSYFTHTPRPWGALSMLNILAAIVGLAVIAAVLRAVVVRAKRR